MNCVLQAEIIEWQLEDQRRPVNPGRGKCVLNKFLFNKSQYFKGTNNNNRDSEIYAIAKEEILGIPILGFCLQMSETKLNILQVPVQEKYKLWIDQASTLVAVD